MKKADNFDASKWLIENKITKQSRLNEGKVKNQYVVKDEEESDEYGDFYVIDKKKALEYLKQFNNKEVSAKQFIKDDEGWGEFEQYLEDVELMSDKQLEKAMREEMSFYYFSNPDEINENETLKGFAQNTLSPNMQKQFDMIVSALKKAKTEEEVDKIYYKIVMLPNKVSKIFFDKLVDMGLAEYEGEGISLNFDN
jgi:hypothetical protein